MNLRRQLQYLLKTRNLTASQLSRKSGVSKQRISDWLIGVQPRSIPQVKKVADALGISLETLCFGRDSEKAQEASHMPPINRNPVKPHNPS